MQAGQIGSGWVGSGHGKLRRSAGGVPAGARALLVSGSRGRGVHVELLAASW
jgi:hypothetical protein